MATYKLKEDLIAGNCSSALKFLRAELALIRKEEITEDEREQLSEASQGLLEEVTQA